MAIEIKYAVNMALQYNNANEFNIEDYLLADNETGKLFLTESPTSRVLNQSEKSALYFLVDDTLFNASALYELYDSGGTKINEVILELGYDHLIHNAIPVNLDAFYVPPTTTRMNVSIVSNQNNVNNGGFSEGSGDTFTGWIKNEGNGSIVQSATGGLEGTRAVQLNRVTNLIDLRQLSILGINTNYTISLWVRRVAGSPVLRVSSNTTVFQSIPITNDEFTRININVTTGATDTGIFLEMTADNSSIIMDDVMITQTDIGYLTEIKSYQIDRECYDYSFQINWLNKLGGRDTFMFTAKPNIETTVGRNNLIELSKLSNFESPKRIYGYREHISSKTYNLVHRCKDRETADWLKGELIDSIDVMIVINDYYYPVLVLDTSIQEDKISHDYTVNFQFRLAFDNNIQTR